MNGDIQPHHDAGLGAAFERVRRLAGRDEIPACDGREKDAMDPPQLPACLPVGGHHDPPVVGIIDFLAIVQDVLEDFDGIALAGCLPVYEDGVVLDEYPDVKGGARWSRIG